MPDIIQYVCVLLCGAGSWDLFKQGVLHFCQDFLAVPKVKPIRAWDDYRAEVQGIALTQHFWYFLWRGLECFCRTATYPAYVSTATCSSGARIFAVLFLCFRVFVRLQIIGNAFAFPQYEASDFGDASKGGRGQNQIIFHLGMTLHLPSAVLVTPRSHTRPHPHQNPHPSHTKTLQPSAAHQAQPAVLFYLRRFNKRRPAWRVLFKRNGVG